MPPRCPKKVPGYLAKFGEFAKKKERKHDVQNSVDVFLQLLTKHWDAFLEEMEKEQSNTPAKTRNVDPIKSLGKAFNKVVERVEEADNNDMLIQQYKDRIKKVVPAQMRDVFGDGTGSTTTSENKELAQLVEHASQSLAQLTTATQKVSHELSTASGPKSDALKKDAEALLHITGQVSHSIEQMKESLQG
jgi:methyl-accepting chemotaxis protein